MAQTCKYFCLRVEDCGHWNLSNLNVVAIWADGVLRNLKACHFIVSISTWAVSIEPGTACASRSSWRIWAEVKLGCKIYINVYLYAYIIWRLVNLKFPVPYTIEWDLFVSITNRQIHIVKMKGSGSGRTVASKATVHWVTGSSPERKQKRDSTFSRLFNLMYANVMYLSC